MHQEELAPGEDDDAIFFYLHFASLHCDGHINALLYFAKITVKAGQRNICKPLPLEPGGKLYMHHEYIYHAYMHHGCMQVS